jgi:phage-related protein
LSAVAGSVVVAIKAVDEASSVFDKIQTNMGLLGGALSNLTGPLGGVGNILSGFAAGGVIGGGIAALGTIGGALQGAIKDAGDSERIMTALGTAITNAGGDWDALKGHVADVLEGMTKVSKFSDEDLAESLRTLVTAGMPVEEAIKALGTAMDTAVGSGQPLNTVSQDIAKAFGGQDSALTRLVPGLKDMVDQLGPGATDGDKFAAAMDGLNEKFSGQAAADAETYAGTQERLKNAMGELGEKVGNILTPALTSLTNDALIPAVDSLGKGIDAVSSWITEVGKMPEVQGTIDSINEAFGSFTKYLSDTWDSVKNDFGPALDELSKAFGDMSDAMQPLWDAFSEIIQAMGGAGGDVNPLKMLLEGVVVVIKGLAKVIELAVPIVKGFADGFKAAADLIAPSLKTISDAIGAFIKTITDAFQGFYDWLVGKSLWQDLWSGLSTVATNAITGLLSSISTTLFDPLKTGFQTTVDSLKEIFGGVTDAITKPISDIVGKIQEEFPNISKVITAGTDVLKGDWVGGLKKLADAAPGAFTEIGSSIQKAIGDVSGVLSKSITDALSGAHQAFTQWVSSLGAEDPFRGLLEAASNAVDQVGTTMGNIPGQFTGVTKAVTGAVGDIAKSLTTGTNNWTTPIENWVDWLIGHSIWPEAWDAVTRLTAEKTTAVTQVIRKELLNWSLAFQETMQDIDTTLSIGFAQIITIIQGSMAYVSGLLTEGFASTADAVTTLVAAVTQQIDSTLQDWEALVASVSKNTGLMKGAIDDLWSWLIPFWRTSVDTIVTNTQTKFDEIADKIQQTANTMQLAWSSTLSTMVFKTRTAFDQMVNDISSRVDAIIARLRAAQAEVSGHSIWPDMLEQMVSQTHDAMAAIQDEFSQGFQSPGGIIPTIQSAAPAVESAVPGSPNTPAVQGQVERQAVTVPVNVYLDGQQIQCFLERRLVETINRDAGRSRRA